MPQYEQVREKRLPHHASSVRLDQAASLAVSVFGLFK